MPPPSRAGAFKLETAPSSFEKAAKVTYSPAERRTFQEGMEKVSAAAFRLKLERFKAGKRRQDGNPSRAGLCFRQPEWIPGKAERPWREHPGTRQVRRRSPYLASEGEEARDTERADGRPPSRHRASSRGSREPREKVMKPDGRTDIPLDALSRLANRRPPP